MVIKNFADVRFCYHRSPRRLRVLNTEPEIGKRGFVKNNAAQAQRHRNDELRHNVRQKVNENSSPHGNTHNFRGRHIFLLAEHENLPPHEPCDAAPTEYRYHRHKEINLQVGFRRNLPRLYNRRRDKKNGKSGNAVEYVDYSHYYLVDDAAEITGYSAENNADERFENYYDESDGERYSAAVHKTNENIEPLVIRTEQVIEAYALIGSRFFVYEYFRRPSKWKSWGCATYYPSTS